MGIYSEELADVQGVTDATSLLDDLGLDLISDNISNQIHMETTSTMDFLDIVITKFKKILSDEEVESDVKSEIISEVIDFCEKLLMEISNVYDLCPDIIEEGYITYLDTLETVYKFFILDRYYIVEQFLIEYIETNKTALIETLGIDQNAKDITSLSNKKKNFESEDVCVMSGISEIIEFITNSAGIEPNEFISLVMSAIGDATVCNMNDLMVKGIINGNFVPPLLHNVLGDIYDNNQATRIRTNIRAHFYAKYQ